MSEISLKLILRELKSKNADIRPVLILAPTQRCGTTLLQRSMNSGGNTAIFGENFFLCEHLPEILGSPVNKFEEKLKVADYTEEQFFNGNRSIDASAFFPSYRDYCRSILSTFYSILRHYDDYSKNKGLKNWGFKHQIQSLNGFMNLCSLLPEYRAVTLYRDLVDVAKSYRARWPSSLASKEQLEVLGGRWGKNIEYLQKLNSQNNLVVKYEELISNTKSVLEKISAHTGAALDLSEFSRKVNAHQTDINEIVKNKESGEKLAGLYRKPAELSSEEVKILVEAAGENYKNLGYSIEKHLVTV